MLVGQTGSQGALKWKSEEEEKVRLMQCEDTILLALKMGVEVISQGILSNFKKLEKAERDSALENSPAHTFASAP